MGVLKNLTWEKDKKTVGYFFWRFICQLVSYQKNDTDFGCNKYIELMQSMRAYDTCFLDETYMNIS